MNLSVTLAAKRTKKRTNEHRNIAHVWKEGHQATK